MSQSLIQRNLLMISQSIRKTIPAIAVLACLCLAQLSIAQDRDRVFPFKGAAVTGKIVERTRDKVVIEVRGNNQNFPSNEIQRVIWDGEPPQLSRTKDLISQGQLDQAVEEFKKVDAPSLKSDEMKQDYQFYRGLLAAQLALRGKGDANNAGKLLLAFVKENPTSHHFYTATEMLGNLALATGAAEQASKYFGALANASFPEFKVKGSFLQGKAMLLQKQTAEAKAKFATVLDAKLNDAVTLKFQKLAKIATIKCDAADGKSDEAIQQLEKIVDEGDSTDAELFSELFNTLGSVFLASGKLDDASFAYLKTDLLYSSQPDAHAEALYNLSQIWPKLGDAQRAAEAKAKLGKLYPTSPWVKK